MCDLYSPQALVQMSGIMSTLDAQYAEQAIMLLKSEPARNFRIEVAADSLVEIDEVSEKESRMEFLQATGAFLQQAMPAVQQAPEMGPLFAEMLLFGVRAFKAGRPLEAAFDDLMAKMTEPKQPQPPQPDPEQIKVQAQMQVEQGRMQLEQAKLQSTAEIEQFKAQQAQTIEAARMEHDLAIEQLKQQAETQRAQMKAQMDAETKLAIAQLNVQAAEKPAVTVGIDGRDELSAVGQEIKEMAEQAAMVLGAQQNSVSQAIQMLAKSINKPKKKVLERGPDGRAIGLIEIIEDNQ
jgi:hypothetical protein